MSQIQVRMLFLNSSNQWSKCWQTWPSLTDSSTLTCYFFGNYLHAKYLRHSLFCSIDIDDQKILQSNQTKAQGVFSINLSILIILTVTIQPQEQP